MALFLFQKRVVFFFFSDGSSWTMSGQNHGLFGVSQNPRSQGTDQVFPGSAWKVGATHSPAEQGVAGKKDSRSIKTDAARAVARSMDNPKAGLTNPDFVPVSQKTVRPGSGLGSQHQPEFQLDVFFEQRQVFLMYGNRRSIPVLDFDIGPGVVHVAMSVENDDRPQVKMGESGERSGRPRPRGRSPRILWSQGRSKDSNSFLAARRLPADNSLSHHPTGLILC